MKVHTLVMSVVNTDTAKVEWVAINRSIVGRSEELRNQQRSMRFQTPSSILGWFRRLGCCPLETSQVI